NGSASAASRTGWTTRLPMPLRTPEQENSGPAAQTPNIRGFRDAGACPYSIVLTKQRGSVVLGKMPDNQERQEAKGGNSFSLELVAMVAVIAISSWHIGNYMSTFDGWIMAAIMGATLGFCNFLCAHNIFRAGSTSRLPSFVGLIFFAITSTWMQYTYFNRNPEIGETWLYGVNLDALALGLWAPAAEILLGWIYAANVKREHGAGRPPA